MENGPRPAKIVDARILAKEYDEEIFDFASDKLAAEFKNAEKETRAQILLGRFSDCAPQFLLKPNQRPKRETNLYDRFGIRPMNIDFQKMKNEKQLQIGSYRSVLLGKESWRSNFDSKGLVYGNTKIFYLEPNEIIQATVGDGDIVSTARLSSCSVLVLKNGPAITMAHLTTPQEIIRASKKIIEKAGAAGSEVTLITPEFFPIQGDEYSELSAKKFTANRNELLETVQQYADASHVKLKTGGYPYISTHAYHDSRIFETAVVASSDTCETFGYSWKLDDNNKTSFDFYPDTKHSI